MTTLNIEELIASFPEQNPSNFEWNAAQILNKWGVDAAAALQSQAERIKELEEEIGGWREDQKENIGVAFALQREVNKITSERDELREKYTDTYWALDDAARENTSLHAQLEAIAAAEPVYYEFQWTNPGNQPHQPESMFVWARVEPAWNGTVQQKVDELLTYRYDDKPTYRVRALFTRPMPVQDVTELVELLEFMWRDVSMNDYAFEKLEAALAKYKGEK